MNQDATEFEIQGPLPMPSRIHNGVLRQALDAGDQEACGLFLGKDSQIIAWYPCRNAHADPTHAFLLHPHDLRLALELAERLELQILGLWHSHPMGPSDFSSDDEEGRPDGWLQWLVVPKQS